LKACDSTLALLLCSVLAGCDGTDEESVIISTPNQESQPD
jgi:hypothetical protein